MRKMFALNANGQKIYQTVGDFIEYGLRMNVLLWCIWLTLTVTQWYCFFCWFIPHWWPQFFLFTSNTLVIENTLFSWHIARHIAQHTHSLFVFWLVEEWKSANATVEIKTNNTKIINSMLYLGSYHVAICIVVLAANGINLHKHTKHIGNNEKELCVFVILIKFSHFHFFW